ncbi:hypothetical protein DMB66_06825 [Actinoplanes sp. ATCC 53533]|uniref:hypothetical protein n=1 Tax=Actinoplanes sp. ATCC 53533 TaxID=1288362 RepID=UPI000F77E678|nr:hypothetical protein [Actinoplanes sp. ATCC 53533]RSM72291.1 hypothetical protein DMB66_06825 [Actinoplanes sp. ATCC 53533]
MTAGAYSFLPWLRRGIATRINAPAAAATRAAVTVKLSVRGAGIGGGVVALPVEHEVAVYGPGDVVGVDPRAIVRTDPHHWITNFDPNYLPAIEFYDEDFPWRYSPAVVEPATGRLQPWLALIVLSEDEFRDQGQLPGRPLPSIGIDDLSVLPPADQLGAWAHVHVNRTITASDAETVAADVPEALIRLAAVVAENPDLACSRLLCPRRLDPEQGYHAFLVPTFETGRLAGLGLDPAGSPSAVQSSWVDYAGRPEPAGLCYYHRWQFRTSPVGDFEYLARLLKPRTAGARVGSRDMDVRAPDPELGLPGITSPQLGGVLRLGGALKVPDKALNQEELAEQTLYENWDQPYPTAFQQALAAVIDLADDYLDQRVTGVDPLVTPPLYGRWHARVSRLLTERDGTAITPNDNWVHELNLDPRFRVPAGLGGRVVRTHDEEYMRAAWDQLGDVLAANKRIRAAQVARELGFSLHRGHLEPLRLVTPGQLLTLSAPVQSRLLPGAGFALAAAGAAPLTIAAGIADSRMTATVVSPVLRRITRPGSRLMRGLPFGPGAGTGGVDVAAGAPEVPPARQDLLARMNDGTVTAAPPKVAPAGVVTVDALEEVLAGPVIGIAEAAAGPVPNPVPTLATSADFVISLPGEGVSPTAGGTDSIEAARFKQALNGAYEAFNTAAVAGAVAPRDRLDLDTLAEATMDAVHPDRTVPRRAMAGMTLPARFLAPGDGGDGGVITARSPAAPDLLGEVMAYPIIDLPMFRPLMDMGPELFCPNIDLVLPDSVTLLETNPRFIESYLVGLNHEMSRELLWREYPTDQRGSVFRQFWDVRSGLPLPSESAEARRERLRDIPPIDVWDPASALGAHNNRGASVEELVLVIRGELLKKYPTAVIYAHRAVWTGQARELAELGPGEADNPPHDKVRMPAFDAKLDPDIYFFGFDLTEEIARGDDDPAVDAGWFFVLKERPGEPRFGLDIEREGALEVWNDLAWPDVIPAGGGAGPTYIRLDADTPTPPLETPTDPEKTAQFTEDSALTWNAEINAADLAYILFQAPVLIAIHAREMLQDG